MSCVAQSGMLAYRQGGLKKAKTQWNPMVVFGIAFAVSFVMLMTLAMIAIISYIALPMPQNFVASVVKEANVETSNVSAIASPSPGGKKVDLEILDLKGRVNGGQMVWTFKVKNTGNVPVALIERPFRTVVDGKDFDNGGEDPIAKKLNSRLIKPGEERGMYTSCGIFNSAADGSGPLKEKGSYNTAIQVLYKPAWQNRDGSIELDERDLHQVNQSLLITRLNRIASR